MAEENDSANEPTAMMSASVRTPRDEPRFTPGTMLDDRYRIVSLLGTGGMGEVYRAEDTKLGQTVALKFLPHTLKADPVQLERLYSEVRLGRQVSHPNVCRMYDVGEWNGNHFLAMEYVDGEDLSSLLRRIGKLPPAKALDIAREVCAGLAAAHGLGIIHRDLKPANIMIDGRGQARITDFGLAVVAEDLANRREIAGTPAYMAPEQLTGGSVTQKSDLYALGLVLYEIFTGKRLFDGQTSADVVSRRSSVRNLSVSSETREIDPAVHRVITRCVEEDPDARPPSIHSVIAALPGGDPLQAALDAGETPSPQMVAAAGEVGDVRAPIAWSILLASILGMAAILGLFGKTMLFRMVPLPIPPEALAERARSVLAEAGYGSGARDRAYFFERDDDFYEALIRDKSSVDRWSSLDRLRPGVFVFIYRESPHLLVSQGSEGRITPGDPPMIGPGMTRVHLDVRGRLLGFEAVPPRLSAADMQNAQPVDWSRFFTLAGGDIEGLERVPVRWAAPVDADEKFAWEGYFRGQPETRVRIEAGSSFGKPVWFRIKGPWVSDGAADPGSSRNSLGDQIYNISTAVILVVAVLLARRNLRRSRGDRRGANRLAMVVLAVGVARHLLRMDHVSDAGAERELIENGFAWALLGAAIVWVAYLALEPFVRRRWPHTLIGWTRLFSGRFRDPMIGRDLAIGTCGGILVMLIFMATIHAPTLFGQPALSPIARWTSPLTGLRHLLYSWLLYVGEGIWFALSLMLMLLVLLMLLRRRWAAVIGVWLILTAGSLGGTAPLVEFLMTGAAAAVMIFLLVRYGILSAAIAFFTMNIIQAAPLTLDPSAWYFSRSVICLILLAAMMGYGFVASLGNKPAFRVPMLDD